MLVDPPTSQSSLFRRLWWAVGVLLIGAILFLSLMPDSSEEDEALLEGADKYEHVLAYCVLMFWFAHLESTGRGRLRLAIGITGWGVAIECLQGLIGHREF
jgi:hypothetical protein